MWPIDYPSRSHPSQGFCPVRPCSLQQDLLRKGGYPRSSVLRDVSPTECRFFSLNHQFRIPDSWVHWCCSLGRVGDILPLILFSHNAALARVPSQEETETGRLGCLLLSSQKRPRKSQMLNFLTCLDNISPDCKATICDTPCTCLYTC